MTPALILALLVVFAVCMWRGVIAAMTTAATSRQLPEGYTIETTEHWHDFFQRTYWHCQVLHNGQRVASGGGSMTTSHGEAMRIGRDLLRLHLAKEATR